MTRRAWLYTLTTAVPASLALWAGIIGAVWEWVR